MLKNRITGIIVGKPEEADALVSLGFCTKVSVDLGDCLVTDGALALKDSQTLETYLLVQPPRTDFYEVIKATQDACCPGGSVYSNVRTWLRWKLTQ